MNFMKGNLVRVETVDKALGDRELKELSISDAAELCQLASDFQILNKSDVKDAIAYGHDYNSVHRVLMDILEKSYDDSTDDDLVMCS